MKKLTILLALLLCLTACTAPVSPEEPSTVPTTVTTTATAATEATTVPTTTTVTTTVTTTAPTTAVPTTTPTTAPPPKEYPMFLDENYAGGIVHTHTANSFLDIPFSYSGENPVWRYTQEGSRYNLGREGEFSQPAEGVIQYKDPAKLLWVDTNTGMFKMDILGSVEYPDEPRKSGEKFPGALMSPIEMREQVFVTQAEHIYIHLDFTLDEVEMLLDWDTNLDIGLHTAQWNYYVFVQDSKSNAWFYVGLPLYDWRTAFGGGQQRDYISTDPGTGGTFVFIPSVAKVFGEGNNVKVGERFTVKVDLMPYILEGFDLRFSEKNLDDFYISGCNLGWELPGTFDCRATVYDFNMTYVPKEEKA